MKNNLYFSRRSPVDMEEVREQLIENGANEAEFIKANKSIEDWFLYDFEGVKRYIRLSKKTVKEAGTGQEVIKNFS